MLYRNMIEIFVGVLSNNDSCTVGWSNECKNIWINVEPYDVTHLLLDKAVGGISLVLIEAYGLLFVMVLFCFFSLQILK